LDARGRRPPADAGERAVAAVGDRVRALVPVERGRVEAAQLEDAGRARVQPPPGPLAADVALRAARPAAEEPQLGEEQAPDPDLVDLEPPAGERARVADAVPAGGEDRHRAPRGVDLRADGGGQGAGQPLPAARAAPADRPRAAVP